MGVASTISRTSSMPNLLDSNSESDGGASTKDDGDHKSKLTSPSPAPSEPCFSLKSATSQIIAGQGPPKPPRDPNRVFSSSDIRSRRKVNPSFGMRNETGGSTTSLPAFANSRTSTHSFTTSKDTTEFIWKAPPVPFVSQTGNMYENRSALPYSRRSTMAVTQDNIGTKTETDEVTNCSTQISLLSVSEIFFFNFPTFLFSALILEILGKS